MNILVIIVVISATVVLGYPHDYFNNEEEYELSGSHAQKEIPIHEDTEEGNGQWNQDNKNQDSSLTGPNFGPSNVNGPAYGPSEIKGPHFGSATLTGPSVGPATLVGPRVQVAHISGPVNEGAVITRPQFGGVTYNDYKDDETWGHGHYYKN